MIAQKASESCPRNREMYGAPFLAKEDLGCDRDVLHTTDTAKLLPDFPRRSVLVNKVNFHQNGLFFSGGMASMPNTLLFGHAVV